MRRYSLDKDSSPQPPPSSQPLPPSPSERQSPPANKITIKFPSQAHDYDEDDPTNPVPIYLHSPSNRSVKIQLAAKISVAEIKKVAAELIGIKQDRQLLYLNGKNVTEYGFIRLQPQTIIHVMSTDELCAHKEEIQVKLTVADFTTQERGRIVRNLKIDGGEKVDVFIRRFSKQLKDELKLTNSKLQFYLLESSRLLQTQKTFAEQDVGRICEMVCVITEHQIKTRFTNDTKEEILHDISELLGFSDEPEPKQEERPPRHRYTSQTQSQQREETKQEEKKILTSKSSFDQDDPYGLSAARFLNTSASAPNFKKKNSAMSKTVSFDESPYMPLAKKIKARKPKKYLDLLLSSEQRQKSIFESPQALKQQQGTEQKPQQVKQVEMDTHKPQPQIPKTMPIKQRRQIRLQIDKLFDSSDDPKPTECQIKEEKKPISPPTTEGRPVQRGEKMRLSMGARPAFLDQLRLPKQQQQQE